MCCWNCCVKWPRTSTLLVVLHNQKHAASLADRMALLAGGRVQEARGMEEFLSSPMSAAGPAICAYGQLRRRLTLTWPCWPRAWRRRRPGPSARPCSPHCLAHRPVPSGPRKVTGLKPKARLRLPPLVRPLVLRGWSPADLRAPLPGAVNDMEHDLAALKRVGISHFDHPDRARSAAGRAKAPWPGQSAPAYP